MKLFNNTEIRIDGTFPMFLREYPTKHFQYLSFEYFCGWGNGYVGLPNWHPFYKVDYNDINVKCHGDLTFSALDEEEDLWVIGFDTSHGGDNMENCPFEFVRDEAYQLMKQCCEVKEVQRIIKLNKLNKLTNE